ncbi:MAG TPA: KH domain-containing protein [Firmicutes bacterium]|nr:KH domain-containing protein [Bacillota bacterium]
MKELIEYIACSLVENPAQVSVKETKRERSTILELSVAPDDMGKVIGKQGRIARSIRTVLKAYATKNNEKASLDIV